MGKRLHFFVIFFLLAGCVFSQQKTQPFVTISGTVYDITARRPIEAVAVISTSGRGTITDSLGRYSLTVKSTDSIWFSLLNKSTMKYSVDTIRNTNAFDIMIHIKATDLPEVKVRNNNYRFDSLQNRKDYAKYFDFKKPGISLSKNPGYNPGGVTVGLDLDDFINMFRFKRNRSLEALQKRLLQQEQDKYIDHRFSKQFVRKITRLQTPELDTFMTRYRPAYEFTKMLNDLELGYYIERCYDQYKAIRNSQRESLRKKDEE